MSVINRYNRPTQGAQYNPLSLQEIMMVPLLKRQQHDELLNNLATTQSGVAQVDPLDLHSEAAIAEQSRIEQALQRQIDEVATTGITGKLKSDFMKLNADYQKAMSPTGTLGKIQNAKAKFDEYRDTYIANATQLGYGATEAADNWRDHSGIYEEEFRRTGKISEIDQLYAPNYWNVVDEFNALAEKRGFNSEDISTITSNIVDNGQGTYILTKKGREALKDDKENLDAVERWINSNLNNPNSDAMRSITHQRKTKEDALSEIAGLSEVYRTKEVIEEKGNGQITGYTPKKVPEVQYNPAGDPMNFINDVVEGIDVRTAGIDSNSPILITDQVSDVSYKSDGSIDDSKSKHETYDAKVEWYRNEGYIVDFDPHTGLYKASTKAAANAGVGSGTGNTPTLITKDANHLDMELDKIRETNPFLADLTDKELVEKIGNYKQSIQSNFVKSVDIVGSNYEWLNARLFGDEGSGNKTAGIFGEKGATINGKEITALEVAKELGYDNMDDFKLNGKPTVRGYSPAVGKVRAVAINTDGEQVNMFIDDLPQLAAQTPITRKVSKLMLSGTSFAEIARIPDSDGMVGYKAYFVNDFSGQPYIVYSNKKDVPSASTLVKKVPVMGGGYRLAPVDPSTDIVVDYNRVSGAEITTLLSSSSFQNMAGFDTKK